MLKNRNIPFGYCMINGEYAVNNSEADAIHKIFTDFISGKSIKTITAEMKIPYNSGKTVWNINMVYRILENKKYLGGNGFPKIISGEEFGRAAKLKAKRNTYRKPAPKKNSRQLENIAYEYDPTEEIQRMTNEINRLLDFENADNEKVEALIIKLAQLKYSEIKEVRT